MTAKRFWLPILLMVFGLLVVSCGSGNKEAATAAMKAAEAAIESATRWSTVGSASLRKAS